ncbi:ACP S-malonyltransferase [Nostocoides sp.]|uniref:ACP S-malonyltransferase n=1 Tax=Nostocoides sp. TaxID=1917966 RepID=UPI002BBE4A90|nr:ACP S-malonyltransferase [Tetrasphaera sp.]
MLAIVCPGQGSQTPGFLTPWLELTGLRERAEAMSAASGIDIVAHGTLSDEETIKDTAIAQPLIVAAGLLTLAPVLGNRGVAAVSFVAGHSVGEITAAAATGVLGDTEAVAFVAERGAGMAAASAVTPTGMSAILGGDATEVLETLAGLGLTPANSNGAGQIVAAGTLEQLAALADNPPARARVIPLKVAGAFHTAHMAAAVTRLATFAESLSVADPVVPVVSNADGQALSDGTEILARLVSQVTNPVRWDQCMETLVAQGVTGLIEVAPAGTLVGLAKRAMKGVETLAVKTPDDLDAAARMLRDHGTDIDPEGHTR